MVVVFLCLFVFFFVVLVVLGCVGRGKAFGGCNRRLRLRSASALMAMTSPMCGFQGTSRTGWITRTIRCPPSLAIA
eukprot:4598566-Pyramimonas_sp.AAC.1